MKRIVLFLILLITSAFFVSAVCGQAEESDAEKKDVFDPEQVKTMEDIFRYEDKEECQEAYSEKVYVYVFQTDDIHYRAVAVLPEEVSKALWEIDFFDEDRDQKINDLISPLEITKLENLTEQIPSQEELDQLVGKVGQDLFDDGWTYWYYNLADMEAGLYHDAYDFVVRFKYDGEPMVNSDDFDFYEAFKDLPVLSVKYNGIGDASNLDEYNSDEQ